MITMQTKPTSVEEKLKRLLSEAITVVRFGLVGVAATFFHILVVSILLSKTLLTPLVANAFAFLVAFGISFAGHYVWTFQSPGNPGKALQRFLLISSSAFAVNSLILAAMLRSGWLSPFLAAILSATVIPAITFFAIRLWGFEPSQIKERSA